MPRLSDINTTDLRRAIALGCHTMSSVFDADDNDVPFMGSRVWPEAVLRFSWAHSESHVPGRHLNALLAAERLAGVRLDEDAVDKHARAAYFSYAGPVPLPLNRQTKDGPLVNFLVHNIREGFHALYALARHRDAARARALAEASIAEIGRAWDPRTGWDVGRYEGLGLTFHDTGFITGIARALGPLVKYYRATGYAPALELASRLAEHALDGYFPPDGAYIPERQLTHGHSTTCVLSSLAQLADLTGDAHLLDRVQAFYDNGLWEIRDAIGWSIESTDPARNSERGEVNNSGDILEAALILGRHRGARYYHDAERILRCHILPSQLRDVSFIQDPPNPENEDGKRDLAARHRGAWGFPAPYGHRPIGLEFISFNMDIVGGTVASLCEAYAAAVESDQAGHRVNLLFDRETDALEVESPYTHPALRVRAKQPGPLWVRLPPWVPDDRLAVEGAAGRRLSSGYLFVPEPPVNRFVTIRYPLVESELTLEHRTRRIRARLRGDAVATMENFGADFTFFEPL